MSLRSLKNILINSLPFIFIFIASLYRPWDSDLGWHLKYGEYFFKTGQILKANTFSTEMSDFIWPNAAWLTDIISYFIFNLGGFFGLTLAGALAVVLTFYFFSKAFELSLWEKTIIFPLLLFFESPVNQISFRGQLVSIMILGIMMWLVSLYEKGNKRAFLGIIPLFMVWANTHGQFILGLAVYGLWNFFYLLKIFFVNSTDITFKNFFTRFVGFLIKDFKEVRFLGLVFVATILATLIHPYGVGIYTDAFLHFGNKDLQAIMEYLPFDDLTQPWWNQMMLSIILFFGIIILFFTDQIKKQIHSIGVTSVLYMLSWDVRRYAWSLYYLAIPLLKPIANFLKPDSQKNSTRAAIVLLLIYIAFAISLKHPFNQFTNMDWQVYCTQFNNCSDEAIKYVANNKLDKNLYSMYNWGGYMIWNYPQVKPSIDGRMHLWRDEKGYSAFSNYYAYEQGWEDIDASKYDVVLMGNEKQVYERLEELVELGRWEKKYEDEFGGVFVRIKK